VRIGGMMKRLFLLMAILLAASMTMSAEDAQQQAAAKKKKATSGELFETIARRDAAVFDAFNAHDVARLMAMFTDDLEFYDDGGDGNPKGAAQVKEDFGKMFTRVPDLHRELVPGTLEVYPLAGYGAIAVGEHRFCHEENGKADCGITKFSMVWRQVGDTWKLSRVLSYAH
jgi:ketosteroid isomerase-like protein